MLLLGVDMILRAENGVTRRGFVTMLLEIILLGGYILQLILGTSHIPHDDKYKAIKGPKWFRLLYQ
jgi:hypothetical protein